MTLKKEKGSIQSALKELEAITKWFEKDDDFDVEEGLVKVKEGVALVGELKERLAVVENEFRELRAQLHPTDATEAE